jgi:hypothetical protein
MSKNSRDLTDQRPRPRPEVSGIGHDAIGPLELGERRIRGRAEEICFVSRRAGARGRHREAVRVEINLKLAHILAAHCQLKATGKVEDRGHCGRWAHLEAPASLL